MGLKALYKKKVWGFFENRQARYVQKDLKNKDITIIASNCCGGVMYKLLGLRFDSPTINMWFDKKEFCKFCSDLPYYLEQKLVFYKKENWKCPWAYLGEGDKRISIQFTHYNTEQEAEEKWNERKKRIHWDNMYIVTCDGSNADANDFALLDKVPCKRKIVFTSKEHPEIKDSFVLKSLKKYDTAARMQLTRHPITGYRSWQREFNYLAWFNDEDDIRIK